MNRTQQKFSVVVLTVSDRSAAGERDDLSGPAAAAMLDGGRFEPVDLEIVPDEFELLRERFSAYVARDVALVLTTGGTGFSPRDVTPEATISVLERRADGMSEAMRAASLATTRHAMLSRGVCGIAGRTLFVNLPGSPKAVRECLEVVLPVIPHALELLRSDNPSSVSHDDGGEG